MFFTFDFHILPKQRYIGARIIPCCISIKKILRVDPFTRQSKLSLKLLDVALKRYILLQNRTHIMTIINIIVFCTCFLSPTDQKCADSSTFWQFFYYRPPGKFWYTVGEIVKMWCQELNTYLYKKIFCISSTWDYIPLFRFFFQCWKKKFFKSWQVCDWLVKWVNHVGLYGS